MRARATLVSSALLLTLTAACGDQAAPTPDAGPTPSDSPSTGGSQSPSIDPDHVMPDVGPRTGEVANPDILITSAETLSDEIVESIKALEGVRGVEQFSMVQVVIENEAINVAAVNPATYRNYTELAVADSEEIWNRVAGGELALRKKLAKKLPQDENQFVTLGSTEDAKAVHIGALTDTVAEVDAVVNETWIDDLDMVADNALLVRTGATAPQTLRAPIEKLAGEATVAMVDAIALNGLDPDVQQVAVTTGTVADVVGVFRYTVIGGGRIAPEPSWVASHITTQPVPILGTVTCNKYLFPQLVAALQEIVDRGLADKIHPDEYAGCYYPRFIAGSTKLSNHSFGLALDFNVPGNQRGTVGEMDRTVVSIFKKWGFGWGGDWSYTDPMHFEMVRLVDPRSP
ncbi:M15 family metallopeptidase [Nocardioides dilutus]